jgi:hypothetical protein
VEVSTSTAATAPEKGGGVASGVASGTAHDLPLANPKRLAPLLLQIGDLVTRYLDQQPPVVPGLQLSPRDCTQLEETLGLGATRTREDFLAAVGRLASMKIGDIRIPFTPGQLYELQYRAQKRGRSVEAEMKAVVARIEDELFYKGG